MVQSAKAMRCTNRSGVKLALDEDDPGAHIDRRAQEVVLRARDAEWEGSAERFEATGAR